MFILLRFLLLFLIIIYLVPLLLLLLPVSHILLSYFLHSSSILYFPLFSDSFILSSSCIPFLFFLTAYFPLLPVLSFPLSNLLSELSIPPSLLGIPLILPPPPPPQSLPFYYLSVILPPFLSSFLGIPLILQGQKVRL